MSEAWARAALAAYGLVGTLAYPAIGPYVGWRAARGKEEVARRRERYGHASIARPGEGPLIWVHAASIGESAAVAPLVRSVAAEGVPIVMTTGTVTSAAMVRERLAGIVIHQYVPLDMKPAIRRFLNHWKPDLAIIAESEIWPMTMLELRDRRIPQILVNARLSDRSFRRWRAVPSLAEALLENMAYIVAQSEVDGERFHLLGARAVSVAGNLKADTMPPPLDRASIGDAAQAIGSRPVWAALSTHDGEERLAARVHLKLREERAQLLTVIVPRHVERGDQIERELGAMGLRVARRSRGEQPDPTTDILLGDTVGEMGFYLRLSEIAFIGKSLTAQGGQNPLEAAMVGAAVVSGRYVQNFRDIYQRLLKNGGAKIVANGDDLAVEVERLLADAASRRRMIEAGRRSVDEMRGALSKTMQALDPFLQPLRIAVSFERRTQESVRR